jgi:hypothetical protein
MPNRLKFIKLDTVSIIDVQKNNELHDEIDDVIEIWEEFRSFSIHG